jgi:NhaA family Na+:H+ antiporter
VSGARTNRLDPPIDPSRDHLIGDPSAPISLVEYGSYACEHCHAAHQVVANLRERFGHRLTYVWRHLPLTDRAMATQAAELVEYADATEGRFWEIHDDLMSRSHRFRAEDLDRIGTTLGIPTRPERDPGVARAAAVRVRDDAESGIESGSRATPTFFINGRRYEGAWDESSLAEAMTRSVGHRLATASLDFARWAPSTGLLLLLMSVLAVVISNTPAGSAFGEFWHLPFALQVGDVGYSLPLLDWINHGLLTVFFLVVGLEIKRELTVGRLASRRAAALPIAGALGGMTLPALLYLTVIAPSSLAHGWGMTIATDTAFAVALIVLLGERVSVELRVFLTAAVIVDDLVAIGVVALFYSEELVPMYMVAAAGVTGLLLALNRGGVYRALPYGVLGVVLWICLHQAGLHATLAGVILAMVTPTRPPANLTALTAQAQSVLQAEQHSGRDPRAGPSEPALRALDAIHDRIESPASKLLRAVEPWSSYLVLPLFALANAGVAWSAQVMDGRSRLVLAVVLGLTIGKPLGILAGSWLAVRFGLADKPAAYTWVQLLGAGALGGIGFTMSLFIAGQAFPAAGDFAAAKIAIFLASLLAGVAGVVILRYAGAASRFTQ